MKQCSPVHEDNQYNQKENLLIKILYDMLKELSVLDEVQEMYQVILSAAARAVPAAEKGSILMTQGEIMRYTASFGFDVRYLSKVKLKEKDTLLYKKTKGRMDQAIIIENFSVENQEQLSEENYFLLEKAGSFEIMSSISIPIRSNNRAVGSLHLDSTVKGAFKREDIEVLELFAFELAGIMKLLETMEAKNYLLRYDEMTGIFNRRYATEEIKKNIKQGSPFILVSMDINDLKIVNDNKGHETGDEYIRTFVQGIRQVISEDVIFARYGGDEFLLLFPETSVLEIEDKLNAVQEDFVRQGRFLKRMGFDLSFSYGKVEFPKDATSYNELIRLADERMYYFKNAYKNKFLRERPQRFLQLPRGI